MRCQAAELTYREMRKVAGESDEAAPAIMELVLHTGEVAGYYSPDNDTPAITARRK